MGGVFLFFPYMLRDVDRDTFNFTFMNNIKNIDYSINIITLLGSCGDGLLSL
jgi:hypothetical protein